MAEPAARDTKRRQRLAENEVLFRQVNERIEAATDLWQDATMSAVCECGDAQCLAPIDLPLLEYQRILDDRRGSRRFIVKPGHEIPEIESVVERHDDYFVVEKAAELIDPALDA